MDPRYMSAGTPAIKLMEECSEVIQSLCKAERFGLDNHHPGRDTTNRSEIEGELDDLKLAIENYLGGMRKQPHEIKV